MLYTYCCLSTQVAVNVTKLSYSPQNYRNGFQLTKGENNVYQLQNIL